MRWLIAWGSVIFLAVDVTVVSAPRFRELSNLAGKRLDQWDTLEQQLKVPGAGLEILGPDVGAAIDLLRAAKVPTYRLSPAIRKDAVNQDAFLTQRIEETAWPIPFDPASPFVLRKIEEGTSCKQLSTVKGMAIDYCE